MDNNFKEKIENVNDSISWLDLGFKNTHGTTDCIFCMKKGKGYLYPNFFKCFSSKCGVQGDKINIYKQIHNLSFIEALGQLEKQYSLDFISQSNEYKLRSEFLNEVLDAYRDQLNKNNEVKDYLNSRGFNKEFIDLAKIGYAPNNKILSLYSLSRNKLTRHLLATKKGDFFWQRIIFPIYNSEGYLVHLTGRSFPVASEDFKYLDTKTIPVIGSSKDYLLFEEQLKFYKNRSRTLYLVEGVPDAFILKQSGINVVGVLGLSKLLSHVNKFEGFDNIIAIFDNDRYDVNHPRFPGQLKSWRMIINQLIDLQLYLGKKTIISTCMIPENIFYKNKQVKDINDLYLYLNSDINKMLNIIKDNTTDLIEYYIEQHNGNISYHKTALKLIAATNRGQEYISKYITSDWSPLTYALKVLVS